MDHTSVGLYDQATGLLVIAQIDSFSDAFLGGLEDRRETGAVGGWRRRGSGGSLPGCLKCRAGDLGSHLPFQNHHRVLSHMDLSHFFSGYQVLPSQ